ncbi:MAG: TonB family protein [Bacteroidales bacterium]|nr:TonB family protein [Bacteroidales bacterium]
MKTIILFLLVGFLSMNSFAQNIHEATRSGDVNKVYNALTNGDDINAQDHLGRTPIMIAALIGNYKVVNYLIENKCDINAKDFQGRTALDYSIRMKNIKITELLQKNSAVIGAGIHDSKNGYKQPVKSSNSVGKNTTRKAEYKTQSKEKLSKPEIYKKEGEPVFPGGNAALHKYLKSNINYPEEARKDSLSGTVHVHFEVTPKGEVTNVEITRSDNPIFNNEAIRIVKEMPVWETKDVDVKRVKNFEFRVPIHFKP